MIRLKYADTQGLKNSSLPEDYLINHISSSFVETVDWWLSHGMQETPEQLNEYFLTMVAPFVL